MSASNVSDPTDIIAAILLYRSGMPDVAARLLRQHRSGCRSCDVNPLTAIVIERMEGAAKAPEPEPEPEPEPSPHRYVGSADGWAAFERRTTATVCEFLADACEGVQAWPGADDELIVVPVDQTDGRKWARVRLRIEVLDGLL